MLEDGGLHKYINFKDWNGYKRIGLVSIIGFGFCGLIKKVSLEKVSSWHGIPVQLIKLEG